MMRKTIDKQKATFKTARESSQSKICDRQENVKFLFQIADWNKNDKKRISVHCTCSASAYNRERGY